VSGIAVITEACIDVKDRACVDVCPSMCIIRVHRQERAVSEEEAGSGVTENTHAPQPEMIAVFGDSLLYVNMDDAPRAPRATQPEVPSRRDLHRGQVPDGATKTQYQANDPNKGHDHTFSSSSTAGTSSPTSAIAPQAPPCVSVELPRVIRRSRSRARDRCRTATTTRKVGEDQDCRPLVPRGESRRRRDRGRRLVELRVAWRGKRWPGSPSPRVSHSGAAVSCSAKCVGWAQFDHVVAVLRVASSTRAVASASPFAGGSAPSSRR
jgi:hypothetical protein